jgi:hypothetical protein
MEGTIWDPADFANRRPREETGGDSSAALQGQLPLLSPETPTSRKVRVDKGTLRTELMRPESAGIYYSVSEEKWAGLSRTDRMRISHVARIMEMPATSEWFHGDARYTRCILYDREYVKYISQARPARAGDAYARCRFDSKSCSTAISNIF